MSVCKLVWPVWRVVTAARICSRVCSSWDGGGGGGGDSCNNLRRPDCSTQSFALMTIFVDVQTRNGQEAGSRLV